MSTDAQLSIAPAAPEDAEELQRVFYKTWLVTYPNEKYGITVEDVEEWFKERLTPQKIEGLREFLEYPAEEHPYLAAKLNGTVVGVCRAVQQPAQNYLHALYVLPEYHGKGIGTALWKEISAQLDHAKPVRVGLAVYNTNAQCFYKKFGFRILHNTLWYPPNFKMKSGNYIPSIEMEKPAE